MTPSLNPSATGTMARRGRWALIAAALCIFAEAAFAEAILVVRPVSDWNDRVVAILAATDTPLTVQRIGLERMIPPQIWGRATAESAPARLGDAKLVVIENAHANALDDIDSESGDSLLEALPDYVRNGGWLLVIGGTPSYGTYAGTKFADILPVVPTADEGDAFSQRRKRKLRGGGADGLYIEHLHPVSHVRGEVLIDSKGPGFESGPFVVRWKVGKGVVVAILGGAHEYYTPDAGHDRAQFFSSRAWERLLLDVVGEALGRPILLTSLPDPAQRPLPVAREGARVRAEYWFPGAEHGRLALTTPAGTPVFSGTDEDGWFTLPAPLRHGRYHAVLTEGQRTRDTSVLIGGAADPANFDIRLFSLSHGPNPFGLAPGEAAARSRELLDAGFTSIVFLNHWSERRQSQRDIRALREIIGAGLDVVYQHTIFPPHFGVRWPFAGRAPLRSRYFDGREAGWDLHDEAFRRGIDQVYDVVGEVRSMPRIRALQPIEEYGDGARESPSLAAVMKARGITDGERPGDAGWYLRESIRSDATGETFQRFRAAANHFLPGVPLATYWPGSYWFVPDIYTARITELARANDELIGPGYGFQYPQFDTGWQSVVISSNEVYAAFHNRIEPGQQAGIFAIGRDTIKGARPVRARAWRDTAWTALAHGATLLAYFDLTTGEALASLGPLHEELTRIGPWIAAAPRRPAAVAVLGSWTTRTAGNKDESFRHGNCLMNLQKALAKHWEEVDVLLEEHADAPPAEVRAIVVAAAPLLTDETVAQLNRFAEAGGLLIVDPASAKRSPDGPRPGDPWAIARPTGRVHDYPFRKGCEGVPSWTARLRARGIEPRSGTKGERTEARLRGTDEILYWLLLNHREDTALVAAHARLDPSDYTWRDLRGDTAVAFDAGGEARLSRRLEPGEAAVFIAVRRPAASMTLTTHATTTRVEIDLAVRDANGDPVADGYPVRIDLRDETVAARVAANARSRVTRGGTAHWSVAIPVAAAAANWTLRAEEPVAGVVAASVVTVGALDPAGESPPQ